MNNEKIAYFAGFFDGEGCIGAYNANGPRYSKRIEVRIAHTYLPILKELMKCYGGHIYKRKKTPDRHKVAYDWVVTGQGEVVSFLNDILPFLREKKSKVEFLLNL